MSNNLPSTLFYGIKSQTNFTNMQNNQLLTRFSEITGAQFTCPIMNGAGIVKDDETLNPFLSLDLSNQIVLAGSYTPARNAGNSGDVYYQAIGENAHPSNVDLNKLGLPNPGKAVFEGMLHRNKAAAINNGKFLGISVTGLGTDSIDEIGHMLKFAIRNRVVFIEVNGSCPNVVSDSKQKPIICYNLRLLESLLQTIATERNVPSPPFVISLKVSPYLDVVFQSEVSSLINQYHTAIDAITTTNTIPNARRYKNNAPVIGTDGYGGASGPGIFPIAVGQVAKWRELLDDKIRIIGVGGISSGADVHEMMLAGADMVQIVSQYLRTGDVGIYNQIYADYLDIVE